jgi:hypothetical protein
VADAFSWERRRERSLAGASLWERCCESSVVGVFPQYQHSQITVVDAFSWERCRESIVADAFSWERCRESIVVDAFSWERRRNTRRAGRASALGRAREGVISVPSGLGAGRVVGVLLASRRGAFFARAVRSSRGRARGFWAGVSVGRAQKETRQPGLVWGTRHREGKAPREDTGKDVKN